MRVLGIDTGGTFTDFVYFDGEKLQIHKVLSTPADPAQAILQGLREMAVDPAGLYLIHGSTVATNALLENKGVRTAYVTNRGLADVLTIGRQARAELYELAPKPVDPPVPVELCFEVDARTAADGSVLQRLDEAELQRLRDVLARAQADAVAINLLFSFIDAGEEHRIRQALPSSWFVSCSADVLPQAGEYERGIATWINASLGPLMQRYLRNLTQQLPRTVLTVMQSSGGTVAAGEAGERAVHLLLSGPAGGLTAARAQAAAAGVQHVLSFDMGGTSTDVALIDGDIRLTIEGRIGRYPVSVPMVDMHTIGAGGGSIAFIDAGGLLQVGPQSAGANPGPACYGQGGARPTVTDANVVLGRLPMTAMLGGSMTLDRQAARLAVQTVAEPMQLSIEQAAAGIVQLANEHMAQALRVISVQRGVDVGDYSLMCFGGAGGLHVCALAQLMNMRKALVPMYAGVLSALGMLLAPKQRVALRTMAMPVRQADDGELACAFDQLAAEARAALRAEGCNAAGIVARYSLDLRYHGQSYCLPIAWTTVAQAARDFHAAHQQRYGHAMDLPVELVNIRAVLQGPPPPVRLPQFVAAGDSAVGEVEVHGYNRPLPCYRRAGLTPSSRIDGPAIILEPVATTFVETGWHATVDCYGNLLLGSVNAI